MGRKLCVLGIEMFSYISHAFQILKKKYVSVFWKLWTRLNCNVYFTDNELKILNK